MYIAVAPYRVLDTRTTGGTARGSTITIDTLLGDVAAAAVQITVADTAGAGFLTAWSDQDEQPETSVLNFRHPNDIDGNFVIVPVRDGKFRIYTSETTGIIVDVMGYATTYSASTPSRVATRAPRAERLPARRSPCRPGFRRARLPLPFRSPWPTPPARVS